MDDQERLSLFADRVQSLPGLSEEAYCRLTKELERSQGRFGYDGRSRLKVAFFDAKSYDIESFNQRNQEKYAIRYLSTLLDLDTVSAAAGHKVVCIFVNDKADSGVVESLALQGVEMIALRCAGFNNVDLTACAKHHISVARVPAYSPYAVAEHTVGLMLTLNRGLHHAYARNRSGYFLLEGLTGFDMFGKTVGVIGTGTIGRCVVNILLGMGCRILAYDKFVNEEVAARDHVEYVELERLLGDSDIVTLHIPLFPETYHLIDQSAIHKMKDGVMLINTSRGGLVDARAVIQGLKSGKIGHAGFDVYEEEAGVFFRDLSNRVLTDDVLARLLTFNNVVVTSHQGYLTHEALANIAGTTLGNVAEFESGRRGAELSNAVLAP